MFKIVFSGDVDKIQAITQYNSLNLILLQHFRYMSKKSAFSVVVK